MKKDRNVSTFITLIASAAALLAAACASAPQKQAEAPAPVPVQTAVKPPSQTADQPPAKPADQEPTKHVEAPMPGLPTATHHEGDMVLNPMAGEPLAAPWVDFKPTPPDGQWLVDLEGREYFVVAMPKQEGYYVRTGPNTIRLKHGIPLSIEREDENTFFVKIFKADEEGTGPAAPSSVKSKLTDEDRAKVAKDYEVSTPESDGLSFTAIGAGLPAQGQWRNGFALADVDGDGALDIVHGPPRRSMNNVPLIYRGDGKGGFTRWGKVSFPPYPYDYGDAAAGDFNKDGKIDLAFAIHLRGIVAMLGDGKGNFTPFSDGLDLSNPAVTTWSATPFTSRTIEVVDWNRDGRDDILAFSEGPARSGMGGSAAYTPGKRLYLAGPSGWTRAQGSEAADSSIGDTIALGDFNADKRTDFITGMSQPGNKGILNKAAAGTTWEVTNLESLRPEAVVRGVAAADLNGDRRDEIMLSWANTDGGVSRVGVDLMLTQPGGWVRIPLWGRTGRKGIRSLATGDLDGDGKTDVVGFTDDSQAIILKGLGKGKFTLETPNGIDTQAGECAGYHVALADLDRDGRDEIVVGFAGEKCGTQGALKAWKAQPSEKQ